MFGKLLIANRGEIACRVMRTAERLGIRTVAVYSDADRDALHVATAGEAWRLGPAPASQSYLDIERVIAAAAASGADAVHPGYGFLSENPDFIEACAAAGIVFVGPPAAAVRAMGLKDAAKRLMEAAGVPVIPGYHAREQDDATLLVHARRIGFPVLVKAVAGGGGKGMRRADNEAGFGDALRQLLVVGGIGDVDARPHDGDGAATRIQRGGVRYGVDAARQPADNRDARRCQVPYKRMAGLAAIGGGAARSHHGDAAHIFGRETAFAEEHGRRVVDLLERRGVVGVVPGEGSNASLLDQLHLVVRVDAGPARRHLLERTGSEPRSLQRRGRGLPSFPH